MTKIGRSAVPSTVELSYDIAPTDNGIFPHLMKNSVETQEPLALTVRALRRRLPTTLFSRSSDGCVAVVTAFVFAVVPLSGA